ncbi:SH3 domain-containing protein, partial [Candidatus Dependentiae bacterium]
NYLSAIVYWSKAKRHASFSLISDANYNISRAYDKLGISKEVSFWQELEDYINIFTLFTFQIIFLFSWLLFFVLCIFVKKLRSLILTINMFVIFLFSGIIFFKYRCIKYPRAISKASTMLFVGPNENYHQIGTLSVADKVIVQKVEKNWYKINKNGVAGWVLASNLEII